MNKNSFFKFFILFSVVSAIILNSVFVVTALPELPMIISGNVYINDKIAADGTKITAKIGDKEIANAVASKGQFTLLLQQIEKNAVVRFYVDGIDTNTDVTYESTGYKTLELRVKKASITPYLTAAFIALVIFAILILKWKSSKTKSKSMKSK